jgi:hypothetical protein
MSTNAPKLNEYDVVTAVTEIGPVKPGMRGAVVMVYPGDPPEYEVEFVAESGDTIAVRTVTRDQIQKVVT